MLLLWHKVFSAIAIDLAVGNGKPRQRLLTIVNYKYCNIHCLNGQSPVNRASNWFLFIFSNKSLRRKKQPGRELKAFL